MKFCTDFHFRSSLTALSRVAQAGAVAAFFWATPGMVGADVTFTTPLPPELSDDVAAAPRVLDLPADAATADVITAARGDYRRILAELYDAGYFGASVSITLNGNEAAAISPFDRPSRVRPILIQVTPGTPFRFGTARVTPLPDGAVLPDSFAPNAPASTGAIRDAAQAGVDAWIAASHAKARVSGQAITARHAANRLDAQLTIAPGPALSFGSLILETDSAVRPAAVQRIASFPTGQPFDPDTVSTVRDRLLDTGAFNSVVLRQADTPNADGTLDYILAVEDTLPRRIGGGAELSSSDGLSLEAFWLHRNAFGGAERFRFDFAIEGLAQSDRPDVLLDMSLAIPGFRRPDDTLTFTFEAARRFEPTFNSRLVAFGFLRDRTVNDRLTVGAGADFRFSRVTDAFGTRDLAHFAPNLQGVYDGRDDPLAPTSGFYADVSVRPFLELSDDADSGVQATADLRAYTALNDGLVLAGRAQIGQIWAAGRAGTPAEWLFTSGGGGTVRGLPYKSLGVTEPSGAITGGRGFLALSFEARQSITDTLGIVGFADAGFVSETPDLSGADWHAGAGIGARYTTPLGPLRVDLAVPVRGGDAGDFALYIGIGQAF